jgi:hypothetical protein
MAGGSAGPDARRPGGKPDRAGEEGNDGIEI